MIFKSHLRQHKLLSLSNRDYVDYRKLKVVVKKGSFLKFAMAIFRDLFLKSDILCAVEGQDTDKQKWWMQIKFHKLGLVHKYCTN